MAGGWRISPTNRERTKCTCGRFPVPVASGRSRPAGGVYPTWSRARAELFFFTLDQQIMVASYKGDGQSFRADQPRPWSDARFLLRPRYRSFDLHPDGNRFALSAVPQTQVSVKRDKVVFVFNFFDELRRLAPARKPSN